MIEHFGNIALSDDEANIQNATVLRVTAPASATMEIEKQRSGFLFADRTIKTTINVSKIVVDLDKFIRLPIIETNEYKDDILRIAVESFTYDRRFHVLPDCSKEISAAVLKKWVEDLDRTFIAMFKDKAIGFLALKETASDTLFIHLAAVDEKYRLSGAAMALYANACKIAKDRGYKKIEGRVSTQNSAVMNVYGVFGATYSDPQDIFLKEVSHDA